MTIQRLLARIAGLTMLCVLITLTSFSQTKIIKGKVTDDKGAPVQGATVTVKGSKSGASTGADGSYSLPVSPTARTIIISSVGFTTQELAIGDQSTIDIALVVSSQGLNEVVVVGYGTTRKKDLTGSVVSVQSKDFNQGLIVAPDQLLTGKVAGMEVSVSSGQPGAATTVKIRGNNSIRSGNDPLYVIDGVPLDGRAPVPVLQSSTAIPPPGLSGLGNLPGVDPLVYINPNDIASIDVLKDASAAAIYGSRGANGVILITSKKGSSSTRVDATVSVGVSGLMRQPDILNVGEYKSALTKYGASTDSGQSLNPFKQITQHGVTQNYNLSLSGGNDNSKYRASFLAFDQNGIVKNSELAKYLANFNGQTKFLDKRLSIDFNLTAANFSLQQPPISNDAGSTGNLISAAMNWNPTLRLVNPDGTYNLGNPSGQINPLALLAAYYDKTTVTTILGSITAAYKILPSLEYRILYGVNYGAGSRNNQMLGWINATGGNAPGNGQAFVAQSSLFSQTLTHTLTFNQKLTDKLGLNVIAGYEYWETSFSNQSTYGYGFNYNLSQTGQIPVKYYNNLQDALPNNTVNVSNVDPTSSIQSYFGRAVLNYDDKYLLTATLRDDGSSKFGSNHRYGLFPSVAAGWTISNEDFMKNNTMINNLKLRVGYGVTGNQQFPAGSAQAQFQYTSNGSLQAINIANPDLKWEQVASLDAGLDFSLFGGKLSGYVDYYHKKTENPLFAATATQPGGGQAFVWKNLPGNIINKGYEISLSSPIINNETVRWNLGVNVAHNHNEFFYPALGTAPLALTGSISGQGTSNTFAQAIANQQPVDAFYLKKFQGFDQNGVTQLAPTFTYEGNPNPAWIVGITTDVSYKSLTLTLNMHGAYDYLIYSNTLTNVTNLGNITNGKNIAKSALGTTESAGDFVTSSTRFLYSGNYMKMGNATLSYHFANLGPAKNATFFLTGTNLFEITGYKGFDAEVNIDKNNNGVPSIGIDYIGYPTARTFTLGLNFSL
jgi:TonB-dependent starch-binding outer membrane protein SusC